MLCGWCGEVLAGKRFRLNIETLTIGCTPRGHVPVFIPAGETTSVASEPSVDDRMVDVMWNGRLLSMFVVDLRERGEELPEASGAHG